MTTPLRKLATDPRISLVFVWTAGLVSLIVCHVIATSGNVDQCGTELFQWWIKHAAAFVTLVLGGAIAIKPDEEQPGWLPAMVAIVFSIVLIVLLCLSIVAPNAYTLPDECVTAVLGDDGTPLEEQCVPGATCSELASITKFDAVLTYVGALTLGFVGWFFSRRPDAADADAGAAD